jgi:hypothetical protein
MTKKPLVASVAFILAGLLLAYCSVSSPSELQIKDLVKGTGDQATKELP